ncbi:MAG: hypothetical protein HYY26_02000 [Acidobacteria bacterium]|nr:hypothetical protein [Acidobacteriota bacterium]
MLKSAEKDAEALPRPVLLAFAPLDKKALGMACGLVCGAVVFFATVFLLLTAEPGREVGPRLGLLSQYFLGYSVTWGGSLVGLLWGFATGFVAGWFVALVRNVILALYLLVVRARADAEQYRDFLDHV